MVFSIMNFRTMNTNNRSSSQTGLESDSIKLDEWHNVCAENRSRGPNSLEIVFSSRLQCSAHDDSDLISNALHIVKDVVVIRLAQ